MVDVAEAGRVDMRVYLRRADVRMTEKLLNRADVGAVLKHVRGEAVAEDMRGNALRRDICSNGTLASSKGSELIDTVLLIQHLMPA